MSGKTTEERIDALAKQFAREVFLWEDPFEAPSVPDEETLKKFKEKFSLQDPDLDKHIRTDINCKRALDLIECDKLGIWDGFNALFQEDRAEKPVEKREKVSLSVHKGDIFYTSGGTPLPVLNEKGEYSVVYTFKPCAVLLLDNGEKKSWGDKVFKCAVVTSDKDGKPVEGHDIDLKNGWILHKWLRYKVSTYQLDKKRKVGEIADSGTLDAITAEVVKYSVSDVQKMHFGKDERRLFAMAKYVPIMAETRMAVFEMKEECEDSVFKRLQKRFHKFISEEYEKLANDLQKLQPISLPVAAAGGKESDLIIRSGENAEPKYFKAILKGAIAIDAENCLEEENMLPMWSLDPGNEKIDLDDKVFTLRDRKTKERIGFGYIRNNIAYLEQVLPDKLSEPISKASQVILEVCI